MKTSTVTQAITAFLTAQEKSHNGPDLLDRYLQHAGCMETQINVVPGRPVEDKRGVFTDGSYEWFNIRIPKNANSTPTFRDYPLPYPLSVHVDAIGWTGWDWTARKSRALGFDFDSITGHAAGVGIANEELERVKEAACALPWIEVRRSTGGNGLHLYVYFDDAGVPTENHTVHAALGRATLGMMSTETGFDFSSHIDACGGNMWIWARKMTRENQGLALIKPASRALTAADLPANWQNRGEAHKVLPPAAPDEPEPPTIIPINVFEDIYDDLAKGSPKVEPTERHLKAIQAIRDAGIVVNAGEGYWDTHSCGLSKINPSFNPRSPGTDPKTQNCRISVTPNGFRVYFFGSQLVTQFKFPDECGLTFIPASELFVSEPRVRPFVIDGYLQVPDVAGLNGGTKTFKSWLVLQMLLSVAFGRDFLGHRTHPGRVLLLDLELHPDTIHSRLKKVAQSLGIDPSSVRDNFDICSLRSTPMDIHGLCSELSKGGPRGYSLIAIDPQYKLYPDGFNENDNAHATRFMSAVIELAAQQNSAIVLVHHQSKGSQAGKATRDLGSGAGAFARAVDWHCGLVQHEDEDTVVMRSNLRALPPLKDVCLVRDGFLWEVAPDKDPKSLALTGNGKTVSDLVNALPSEPISQKDFCEIARNNLRIGKKQFENLLDKAIRENLIHRDRAAANKPYMLSRPAQEKQAA